MKTLFFVKKSMVRSDLNLAVCLTSLMLLLKKLGAKRESEKAMEIKSDDSNALEDLLQDFSSEGYKCEPFL